MFKPRSAASLLGTVLHFLFAFYSDAPSLKAQVSPQTDGQSLNPQSTLKIIVLEGEGAINNIKRRTAREPVVQIVDQNNKPVAGAMVMFTLPQQGAGGLFANGTRTLITYATAEGKAIGTGLVPNKVVGEFQISVNASNQGMASTAVIAQTNTLTGVLAGAGVATGVGISAKIIAIIAVAAGAAAAGGLAAASGGGGNSSPAPSSPPAVTPFPTVSAGTLNVGAPSQSR